MIFNQERRVAITGAASGFGRAMALEYAKQGWKIALGDIHDARGQETLEAIRKLGAEAFYSHVDVRAERDLNTWKEAIVSRWGGLDVIINNAGVATQGSIDEAPLEDWDWVVDINLMGVVRGCRSFVNLFKKQGYGHVVNIASISGLIFTPEMASYNATKAGVVALSETLRTELKPYNIRVTVVCPGFFKTNISETARSPNPHIKKALDKLFAKSKLDANDIARIVFKAVLANKFYVLPHRYFAMIWYLKRYIPAAYLHIMDRHAQKQMEGLKRRRRDSRNLAEVRPS